ncbi:MAG: hypothetical protein QME14_01760 [Methanobacteriaceae archaeon]|nr:hypothetical protein [Methanobacteriaceae archaeon]
MKVEVVDYGYSEVSGRYFVKYRIYNINSRIKQKIIENLEEEFEEVNNDLFLIMYFNEQYYPFKSREASERFDDYRAREEIEMTAYISSVLDED